jgi:DNA-directed RNA polymerase specialized sigma24 family protein
MLNKESHNIPSAPAKNFGLSPQSFVALCNKLKAGDESLFQTIFLAHFEDCMRYLQRKYNLQHEQAYDTTMDALLLFRKRILEDKIRYGNIRFLFTQMASQLYLKTINKKPVLVEESALAGLLDEEDATIDSDVLDALNKAWQQLCDNCMQLLKRFYYNKASLKEIAEEQQKNAAALRKQKQRCVEKLRIHFQQFYSV